MCTCEDWKGVLEKHPNLFQKHDVYGIIISWLEISKEKHYHKTNNYGIQINNCPFCGQELENAS